ncbi:MAG: Hsp70 family protein [Synergistes sp.]|nr:Hsp70 family protein [Synergistes sp.]
MPANLNNYYGIDFGTTTSAVVGYMVMDHKPEQFFYGDDEGRPLPSVVAINKTTGEITTGREAWNKKMELSETCEYFSSVKSVLDRDTRTTIAGREWTPVDIAAELFKTLKTSVKERTGNDLSIATVAIPIGFSPEKRDKLRSAAAKAGITISSFVSEPTAAFFANYEELRSSPIVAVFDWGGGTLDVSILKNENGRISELATAGSNIAGDYIDNKIAQRIHAKIARKKGIELAFSDMPSSAQDLMLVRSERAKRALGDDDTATISINNYGPFGACRELLDYDWFADIVEPEVSMAVDCLKKAIEQSGVGLANIDRIVMVGGSSNLRPLIERMDSIYGEKLFFPDETMWNVGQGAARLAMTPGDYYSNQSIGIILSDNSFFALLSPDTPLTNWNMECHFGIVDTNEEARFVFGGSSDIEESPARFKSLSVPAYRFLQEQIILRAFVDENMVFKVIAGSTMRPREYRRVWDYSQLKCYYKLPEMRVEL